MKLSEKGKIRLEMFFDALTATLITIGFIGGTIKSFRKAGTELHRVKKGWDLDWLDDWGDDFGVNQTEEVANGTESENP